MTGEDRKISELTQKEFKDLMRAVVHEVLEDAGIPIGEKDERAQAREDFRYLRQLRVAYDSTVKVVGRTIVMSFVAATFGIMTWIVTNFLVNK